MLFIEIYGYCILNYFMLYCIFVLSIFSILKGYVK